MMDKHTDITSLLGKRYLRHIFFWTGYILTMTYIHSFGVKTGSYLSWLMNYIIELPVLLGLTYLTTYFVIPKFLITKKYLVSILLIISLFISFSFLNVSLEETLINPYFFPERAESGILDLTRTIKNAFGLIFPVVIFVSVSFTRFSTEKSRHENILERKNLNSELDMIKSRMHPVFLRDSLDDIYVISRENPTILPEMILKISDILHYFLYECDAKTLPLRKEEQSIRNFLGFEKLRYGENFKFDIYVQGDLENTRISPYILFPLIRSVCRFNSDYDVNPGKFFVQFEIVQNTLNFTVSQNIQPALMHDNIEFDWKDEIKMARKRLEFEYAWKYDLDIVETERKLMLKLTIDLA
jgi:hypothetical protein